MNTVPSPPARPNPAARPLLALDRDELRLSSPWSDAVSDAIAFQKKQKDEALRGCSHVVEIGAHESLDLS
jgi:hypothetical protein